MLAYALVYMPFPDSIKSMLYSFKLRGHKMATGSGNKWADTTTDHELDHVSVSFQRQQKRIVMQDWLFPNTPHVYIELTPHSCYFQCSFSFAISSIHIPGSWSWWSPCTSSLCFLKSHALQCILCHICLTTQCSSMQNGTSILSEADNRAATLQKESTIS